MTQVAIHPKKEGYLVGDRIPRKRPNRTKKQSDSEKSSEEETSDGEETEKGEKDLVDWKKTKKLSDLMTYHPKAGVQYGVQSKMLRLQIFHQFLYYVVYGYRGTGPAFKDKFTTKICRAVPAVSIETTEKVDQSGWDRRDIFYVMPDSKDKNDEMEVAKPTMEVEPHVYLKEIGWQRYIPPLEPVYDLQSQPLQQGWFMLNDVILAMPLSIFVLIMPLCYKIEGLEDWLAHPVRRHTLLADLPVILRRMLTFANKHIATLSHHCALLNVMNLLANGPCKFTPNNRSKAFYCFYLRKNASVWDTSISEPQFLFVTQPMEQYKEYRYNFEDMDTVELFWHHLTAVSISTRLGHRLKVSEEERAALKRFDRRTKESTLFRISTGTFDEVNRWIAEDSFPSPLSVDVEIKPGAAGTHPLLFM